MNNDVLLIVLTENSWLYAGLAALLPDIVSLQTGFSTCRLPCGAMDAGQVLIAVDCRIFFRGEWAIFNALKVLRPDATVGWLTWKETGGGAGGADSGTESGHYLTASWPGASVAMDRASRG